jgi:regulatory protein
LEDGESFVLTSSKVSRLGLEEGGEIAEETFEEIMKSLRAACMQRCGTLLGSRDYSEQRLREKLCDAGFPAPLVEDAVDKLHRAGYLDDRRYARSYVRSHLQDRSRLRITRDLAERGISGTDIEEAFAEVGLEEDIEEAQKEQVLRLLRKRGFDPDRATYEERQKTMAFLHRKGYPADLIRRSAEGDNW